MLGVLAVYGATLYRFRQRGQADPKPARAIGQHDHPKMPCGEIHAWRLAVCQSDAHTPAGESTGPSWRFLSLLDDCATHILSLSRLLAPNLRYLQPGMRDVCRLAASRHCRSSGRDVWQATKGVEDQVNPAGLSHNKAFD